jgi:hypothetical protein
MEIIFSILFKVRIELWKLWDDLPEVIIVKVVQKQDNNEHFDDCSIDKETRLLNTKGSKFFEFIGEANLCLIWETKCTEFSFKYCWTWCNRWIYKFLSLQDNQSILTCLHFFKFKLPMNGNIVAARFISNEKNVFYYRSSQRMAT